MSEHVHTGECDGYRLAPRYEYIGNDAVPCIWWCPDIGPHCARCGSTHIELHEGVWDTVKRVGVPWSDRTRARLGLPVEAKWWHQAAAWPVQEAS